MQNFILNIKLFVMPSSVKEKFTEKEINPLTSLDEWEEAVLERYPEPDTPAKSKEEYRNARHRFLRISMDEVGLGEILTSTSPAERARVCLPLTIVTQVLLFPLRGDQRISRCERSSKWRWPRPG